MPPPAPRCPAPLVALAALACLVAHPATGLARTYHAERYDVRLAIDRDGSLEVTERATFVFDGPGEPYSRVYRDIPATRTDGIDVLGVTLDGQPLALDGPAVRIAAGDGGVRVEVRFAPLERGRHDVGLRYRARHAFSRDGDLAHLRWTPVPDRRGYTVEASAVEIVWPSLAEPPLAVRTRRDDGVSVVVARRADAVTIETATLRPNRTYQVRLDLPATALTGDRPQWQAAADARAARRQQRMALGGLACALVVLWFGLVWRRHQPAPGEAARPATSTGPPSALPVALASALVRHGALATTDVVATLADLGRQGFLRIDTPSHGADAWQVTRVHEGAPSHAHEREALALAFGDGRPGLASVSHGQVMSRARAVPAAFRDAVRRDLLRGGWLDPAREGARRTLVRTALLAIGVGIAGVLIVLATAFGTEGREWAWLPAGIALGGVVGLMFGVAVSPLSDRGAAERRRWVAYQRALADAVKRRRDAGAIDWQRAMPFAVASGLGAALVAQASHLGLAAPAWFLGPRREQDTSFLGWLSSATAEGGSHGTTTSVDASGGGASADGGGGGGSGAD